MASPFERKNEAKVGSTPQYDGLVDSILPCLEMTVTQQLNRKSAYEFASIKIVKVLLYFFISSQFIFIYCFYFINFIF